LLKVEAEAFPERKERSMKPMTCKKLGGPCDFELHENTGDEVIHAQDAHLKERVASGRRNA
jgi:hypothetical protein